MIKLIRSYFHRAFRSIELYGLLLLMIFCSILYNNTMIQEDSLYSSCLGLKPDQTVTLNETEYTGTQLRAQLYANAGGDLEKIYKEHSSEYRVQVKEFDLIIDLLSSSFIVTSFLSLFFIIVFFGRFFSDLTIDNLITAGHSKHGIYFSVLLFSLLTDLVCFLIHIASIFIAASFYGWKPPVYLPACLMFAGVSILTCFAVTSIFVCCLFAACNRIFTLIAGALMLVILSSPFIMMMEKLSEPTRIIDSSSERYETFKDAVKNSSSISEKIDLDTFEVSFIIDGKEYDIYSDTPNPLAVTGAKRSAMITIVKADPFFEYVFYMVLRNPYSTERDGIHTTAVITCMCWIAVSSAAGNIIFTKRQLK